MDRKILLAFAFLATVASALSVTLEEEERIAPNARPNLSPNGGRPNQTPVPNQQQRPTRPGQPTVNTVPGNQPNRPQFQNGRPAPGAQIPGQGPQPASQFPGPRPQGFAPFPGQGPQGGAPFSGQGPQGFAPFPGQRPQGPNNAPGAQPFPSFSPMPQLPPYIQMQIPQFIENLLAFLQAIKAQQGQGQSGLGVGPSTFNPSAPLNGIGGSAGGFGRFNTPVNGIGGSAGGFGRFNTPINRFGGSGPFRSRTFNDDDDDERFYSRVAEDEVGSDVNAQVFG